MQTPEPLPHELAQPRSGASVDALPRRGEGIWGIGDTVAFAAGLVLTVSAWTGWYQGEGDGLTLSVVGFHTGALGILVFFTGLAVLAVLALREAGIDLPAAVPEWFVIVVLGSLATIFVLIRVLSIPDRFLPADGRGVGIWISLAAALAVIVAGLLQAAEEL